ncbi:MAG: VOC family protein [Gemmatimonadales bacterium]
MIRRREVPTLTGILETSLYVARLDTAVDFYLSLFELEVLARDERMCALAVHEGQVLLLFEKGASSDAIETGGGFIPAHDGTGDLHIAFAIPAAELSPWEDRLGNLGIEIESRVVWSRGGTSIYFRDPDGHLVELATPGLWRNY